MSFKIICNKCGAEGKLSIQQINLTGKRYSDNIISEGSVSFSHIDDGIEIYCNNCTNELSEKYGYIKPK